MRDMAGSGGPYFSKMLLNALLLAAAKFSPRLDIRKKADEPSTAGWRFRQRVKELLGSAMDESTIPSIQALITVASSVFAVGDEKSTSWLYSGTAFRMIVDLGLHIDAANQVEQGKMSIEDLECRRRVFWGAFIFDKIHSMYQGRPPTLQEHDTKVPIEFMDDYEELELWVPMEPLNKASSSYPLPKHPGCPTYSVTTFSAFCRLSLVMNRIMNQIYSEDAFDQSRQPRHDITDALRRLEQELSSWWSALDPLIKFQPWANLTQDTLMLDNIPNPTVLSLQYVISHKLALNTQYNTDDVILTSCMFFVFQILLHRPYLADAHFYSPEIAPHCLDKCTKAAVRISLIIQCYCVAFTVRRAPYFIAYSAYVATTILIRVAAYHPAGSVFHARLEVCLRLLEEGKKVNAGVRKAYSVVTRLRTALRLQRNTMATQQSDDLTVLTHQFYETLRNDLAVDATRIVDIINSFTMEVRPLVDNYGTASKSNNANTQSSKTAVNVTSALPVEQPYISPFDTRQDASIPSNAISTALPASHPAHPSHIYGQPDFSGFNDIIFGLHSGSLDQWALKADSIKIQRSF